MSYYGNGIGEVIPQKVAMSTVIIGGMAVALAASGVISAFSDEYFLGRAKKKGITYKIIARRNAALGGAIGAIAAAGILAA